MITFGNRFFPVRSAVCFFVEGGIILLSVLVSYEILRKTGYADLITYNDALVRGVVVAFFCQSCMYLLDLYDFKLSHTRGEMFFSLVFAIGFVCIGIGIVSYIVPGFGVEGRMYYLTIVFVALLLLLWRIGFDVYLAKLAPRQNVLVVGTGPAAEMVAREIRERERLGFRFAGFVGDENGKETPGAAQGRDVIGSYADLPSIVRQQRIDKVVVAITQRRGAYPVDEMLALRVGGCPIVEWPDIFEKLSGRIPIDNLAPSFFIFNEGFKKPKAILIIRRLASLVVAAAAIVLLLPLFAVVGILIKIDSPGPVFYTQMRIGQNGRLFRICKFRSMRTDAEPSGVPRWAAKDDPRVTRVGRLIRLSRIDELPQLFNVFRGDIDLVGPRPERPEFVEQLRRVFPYYSLRHTVKPGLTGWAQVMFMYCGTIEESKEKLQYDLFYIKNMSIKLDLLIIFKTIKIVLLGRGAR